MSSTHQQYQRTQQGQQGTNKSVKRQPAQPNLRDKSGADAKPKPGEGSVNRPPGPGEPRKTLRHAYINGN